MSTLLETLIEQSAELVEAVTFDESGVNGRGGNGGLLDRQTMHKAARLGRTLEAIKRRGVTAEVSA